MVCNDFVMVCSGLLVCRSLLFEVEETGKLDSNSNFITGWRIKGPYQHGVPEVDTKFKFVLPNYADGSFRLVMNRLIARRNLLHAWFRRMVDNRNDNRELIRATIAWCDVSEENAMVAVNFDLLSNNAGTRLSRKEVSQVMDYVTKNLGVVNPTFRSVFASPDREDDSGRTNIENILSSINVGKFVTASKYAIDRKYISNAIVLSMKNLAKQLLLSLKSYWQASPDDKKKQFKKIKSEEGLLLKCTRRFIVTIMDNEYLFLTLAALSFDETLVDGESVKITDLMRYLLEFHGVHVDAMNRTETQTALSLAICHKKTGVVEMLLTFKPDMKARSGKTAGKTVGVLQSAINAEAGPEIIWLLVENGATLDEVAISENKYVTDCETTLAVAARVVAKATDNLELVKNERNKRKLENAKNVLSILTKPS
jgi:hypothetical protein